MPTKTQDKSAISRTTVLEQDISDLGAETSFITYKANKKPAYFFPFWHERTGQGNYEKSDQKKGAY